MSTDDGDDLCSLRGIVTEVMGRTRAEPHTTRSSGYTELAHLGIRHLSVNFRHSDCDEDRWYGDESWIYRRNDGPEFVYLEKHGVGIPEDMVMFSESSLARLFAVVVASYTRDVGCLVDRGHYELRAIFSAAMLANGEGVDEEVFVAVEAKAREIFLVDRAKVRKELVEEDAALTPTGQAEV